MAALTVGMFVAKYIVAPVVLIGGAAVLSKFLPEPRLNHYGEPVGSREWSRLTPEQQGEGLRIARAMAEAGTPREARAPEAGDMT